jgi:hypothetical protein
MFGHGLPEYADQAQINTSSLICVDMRRPMLF